MACYVTRGERGRRHRGRARTAPRESCGIILPQKLKGRRVTPRDDASGVFERASCSDRSSRHGDRVISLRNSKRRTMTPHDDARRGCSKGRARTVPLGEHGRGRRRGARRGPRGSRGVIERFRNDPKDATFHASFRVCARFARHVPFSVSSSSSSEENETRIRAQNSPPDEQTIPLVI